MLSIYHDVMGKALDWDINDDFIFTGEEARLLDQLCSEHGLPRQLVMKLLELEVSYEGYARRSNLQRELSELLSRDWSDETVAVRKETAKKVKVGTYVKQEEDLQKKYAELGKVLGDAA